MFSQLVDSIRNNPATKELNRILFCHLIHYGSEVTEN